MFGQKKVAMLLAEFLGTAMLALVVYSIVARTTFPLFSGLAAGATYGLLSLTIGAVSGAHVNPAVTLGMWAMRKIQTTVAVAYIAAQMLGGLAAWGLTQYFLNHSLTSMAGGQFEWRVFVAEAIGTGLFTFGIVAAVSQGFDAGRKALVVGTSFLVGVLVASLASNAVLNPAVAVGIQSWSWTYAVAPLVGGVIGGSLYGMLFVEGGFPKIKISTAKKK
jgi:aquaporin Z